MTTWQELAAGAQPTVPTVPTAGVPAPTPNWRDLAAPAQPAAPEQPAAPAPGWHAQAFGTAAPVPPSPGPDPAAGDPQVWQAAQQLGASPLTPQATAPSSVPVGDPGEASAAVGMRIAASGAAATDVDPDALLRMIQGLQQQVQALTQERNGSTGPDVVKFATAFADHLQAKADAHPTINADPDNTFIPALHKAAQLVNGANAVAAGQADPAGLVTLAKDAGAWVAAHARKFRAIDYDYLGQLAEEVASAAAKFL